MFISEKKSAGMSLIEVLVAMFLFAAGGLAVLTMTTSSLRFNSNSRSVDESVNLARLKMEGLLSLNYNSAQLRDLNADGQAGLNAATAASADYSEIPPPPNDRYLLTWNVAEDVPVNGAKTLAVISSWQLNQGPKKVVFQTIIAEE